MTNMSMSEAGTWRRIRRYGIMAGLIVAVGTLMGCSSSDDASAYDGGNDLAYDEAFDGAAEGEAPAAVDDAVVQRAETRSLIITGALYMTVEDPIAVADAATELVERAGGRIDARNETAPGERDGGSAYLTMRIPADKLDAVVDDLRELGSVDEYTTNSQDVSVEVTDLEARISTLRASTARIEGLLAEAKDISDIIVLENELANRQAELQSLEAQQRGLNDMVSMSTIDLSLTTEPVVIVEEEGPDNFWDGLVSGWNGLVGFVSVALIVIGVLLPWFALIALLVAAVLVPIRLRARRRNRAAVVATASDASAEAPAPKAKARP